MRAQRAPASQQALVAWRTACCTKGHASTQAIQGKLSTVFKPESIDEFALTVQHGNPPPLRRSPLHRRLRAAAGALARQGLAAAQPLQPLASGAPSGAASVRSHAASPARGPCAGPAQCAGDWPIASFTAARHPDGLQAPAKRLIAKESDQRPVLSRRVSPVPPALLCS